MFSLEFLIKNPPLYWADVLWGYANQIIGWRIPVDIATKRVEERKYENVLEIQLASVGKDQDWQVGQILQKLSDAYPVPEETSKRRWLYLTLLWLYENQEKVSDLFNKIEEIYVEYDYPDEIRSFVPYMPPDDDYEPALHTKQENYDRILRKWKLYLDTAKANLS